MITEANSGTMCAHFAEFFRKILMSARFCGVCVR